MKFVNLLWREYYQLRIDLLEPSVAAMEELRCNCVNWAAASTTPEEVCAHMSRADYLDKQINKSEKKIVHWRHELARVS